MYIYKQKGREEDGREEEGMEGVEGEGGLPHPTAAFLNLSLSLLTHNCYIKKVFYIYYLNEICELLY